MKGVQYRFLPELLASWYFLRRVLNIMVEYVLHTGTMHTVPMLPHRIISVPNKSRKIRIFDDRGVTLERCFLPCFAYVSRKCTAMCFRTQDDVFYYYIFTLHNMM